MRPREGGASLARTTSRVVLQLTAVCVLVACLFPRDGYDAVLARAFGLPGLRFRPGTAVPPGSAFSQARKLLGEQAMRRIFELDADRGDAELGITALWKGLEVTAIDGTTMELPRNDVLEGEFGTPADGARPLLRITAHVRTATRRWIGAEIGGYHDGENDLADRLEWSFRSGMLNLADRGFFSMDRFLRFSASGAHLAWRVKNAAKSVPFRTIRALPDGSELVMLHESGGMRMRRLRETGNPHAARLPDTIARLVTFTILTGTRSGRAKTAQIRVLTTLLDHKAFPAREIAALYSERWQIETAFLHPKKTVRGPRRPLRGQSPELARQEAWALLLITTSWPPPPPAPQRRPGPSPASSRSPPSSASSATNVAADVRCQALRAPPRHRKRPDHRPDRRHHLPSPPPSRTSADLRENRGRTPHQPNRGSHIHHRHHKVESPEMDTTPET